MRSSLRSTELPSFPFSFPFPFPFSFPFWVALAAVALAGVAAACTPSSPSPPPLAPDALDDHPPGRSDCAWVAEGCESGDGCSETPDPRGPIAPSAEDRVPAAIDAACNRSSPTVSLFLEVTRELRDKPDLTTLAIVTPSEACGNAIARDLTDRLHVDRTRILLIVEERTRYVHFEVGGWSGKACGVHTR